MTVIPQLEQSDMTSPHALTVWPLLHLEQHDCYMLAAGLTEGILPGTQHGDCTNRRSYSIMHATNKCGDSLHIGCTSIAGAFERDENAPR